MGRYEEDESDEENDGSEGKDNEADVAVGDDGGLRRVTEDEDGNPVYFDEQGNEITGAAAVRLKYGAKLKEKKRLEKKNARRHARKIEEQKRLNDASNGVGDAAVVQTGVRTGRMLRENLPRFKGIISRVFEPYLCAYVEYVIEIGIGKNQGHISPYHTIPYHTILYYTILYHTIPYYTILYIYIYTYIHVYMYVYLLYHCLTYHKTEREYYGYLVTQFFACIDQHYLFQPSISISIFFSFLSSISFIHLFSFFLSSCLFHLSIYLSIYLFIYLFMNISLSLSYTHKHLSYFFFYFFSKKNVLHSYHYTLINKNFLQI